MSLKMTFPPTSVEHGRGERIPLDEGLAGLDVLSVADLERRAVDQRVTLLLPRGGGGFENALLRLLVGVSSMISSLPLRLTTTRSPFLFVTVVTLTS